MNDLFASTIATEQMLSGRFRVHPVSGDGMEPTLRGGWDYVLLAPVTLYKGEGIYLVKVGDGLDLFRVSNTFDGSGGLLLSQENPRGDRHHLSRKDFDGMVVGLVVADIRMRDERFLRRGN